MFELSGKDMAVGTGGARLGVFFRARLGRNGDAAPSDDAGFGFRVDFDFNGGGEGTGIQALC